MRIVIRMLRNSRTLDALITQTKQQVMAATLLQPERSWYLLELARHLGVRPSSIQRELKALTEVGILKRIQNGNRVYFKADAACPIFNELSQILAKTVGLADVLHESLRPLADLIDVTFVYGSIAASSERSTSDVDLMVIGRASLSEIAPLLRAAERRLARPINPTVYTLHEFTGRVRRESHFLKSVLRERPVFVLGGPDELAHLVAGTKSETPSHEPARARRSSRSG